MRLPSTMKSGHNFAQVADAKIQRSKFDRSSGFKTTLNSGFLIPFFTDEVLPGDTFSLRSTIFGRMDTLLHPFMDNVYLDTHFFFVPNRLVWDNWQRFNGEQINPDDSTDFTVPVMSPPVGGYPVGSISDYFGIPTEVEGFEHISLFHRAYNLIYNEWFRDQNLQDSLPVPKDDGPDDPLDFPLQRRGKRHDYFTSALPWPQKGDSVDIPLGQQAPLVFSSNPNVLAETSVSTTVSHGLSMPSLTNGLEPEYYNAPIGARYPIYADMDSVTGYADLTDASAATINQLRQAFQIQKMLERDARGGTRYAEIILSHFGVHSPDARLQRPEYLGGGTTPIQVNQVEQNSATTEGSPQANLAAFATVTAMGHGFSKSFTEHGMILGFVSIRADLNYQQGLNRMWSRQTRYDYYWPALAHIGEQAILNKEIYLQGTEPDEDVFGYQERYGEYRYKPSLITGQFRSSFAQSLDTWHLAQDFATLPVLNEEFIVENPSIDRVLALDSEEGYPQFILDCFHKLQCVRPMPMFGTPGLIDHF